MHVVYVWVHETPYARYVAGLHAERVRGVRLSCSWELLSIQTTMETPSVITIQATGHPPAYSSPDLLLQMGYSYNDIGAPCCHSLLKVRPIPSIARQAAKDVPLTVAKVRWGRGELTGIAISRSVFTHRSGKKWLVLGATMPSGSNIILWRSIFINIHLV